MNGLNKAQVDALFRREAVLMGIKDVVPTFRAAETPPHVFKGAKAAEVGHRPELGTDTWLRKAMGLS